MESDAVHAEMSFDSWELGRAGPGQVAGYQIDELELFILDRTGLVTRPDKHKPGTLSQCLSVLYEQHMKHNYWEEASVLFFSLLRIASF